MADTDYKTLKLHIEELIENIDKVDQEAASFSAAKVELVKIAGDLHAISSDLSSTIKTAEAVLSQVETVAVSNTLETLKNSASRFDESGNKLMKGFAETSTELLSKVRAANEEHAHALQQKIDALTEDFKKKIYIMGGVSIAISIAALICALV